MPIGAMSCAACAACSMVGCAASMQRDASLAPYRAGEPGAMEPAGGSWALVMPTPRTAQLLGASDPRNAPEYARNDGLLGAGRDGPLLATAEWPEVERPDLYYARRVQLETRAEELLFFDRESRYRGWYRGGYNSGGGGAYPASQGTWGFWR